MKLGLLLVFYLETMEKHGKIEVFNTEQKKVSD